MTLQPPMKRFPHWLESNQAWILINGLGDTFRVDGRLFWGSRRALVRAARAEGMTDVDDE